MAMNTMTTALEYMGVLIIKTNHLPTVEYGSLEIGEARYNIDGTFSATEESSPTHETGVAALLWHPDCIGGLTLQGVKVDTVNDIRRNTQFAVASCMKGTGVLRPELCACVCTLGDQDTPDAVTRDTSATTSLKFCLGMSAFEYVSTT
jgi:hypothetical protein